jgi:alanine dehydrogenase
VRIVPESQVEGALDEISLIERLREYFRADERRPVAQDYDVSHPDIADGRLRLQPAWRAGRHIGIKIATNFPGNATRGLPCVMGSYMVLDGRSGEPMALIDGAALGLRTAAGVSGLASVYLSRPDCERLLCVGATPLAAYMILAHACHRPICNVLIWDPTVKAAKSLAKHLNRKDFRVDWTDDLEGAVRGADIVCQAAQFDDPPLDQSWLAAGQHVDLTGAAPDGAALSAAALAARGYVFVDDRVCVPEDAGVSEVLNGDLYDLCRGETLGRRAYRDVTLFRPFGAPLADLAAAKIVVERT